MASPQQQRGWFTVGLFLVGVVALLLRLVYAVEIESSVAWWLNSTLGLDMLTHHELARKIVSDPMLRGIGAPFYQSPLYPYLLAACLVIKDDPSFLAVVQSVLSASTAVLTAIIAARFVSPLSSLAAGFLFAFLSTSIFYVPFFLPATVETFLAAVQVWSLFAAWGRRSRFLWTAAGTAVGLSFMARPNLVAGALGAAAWFLFQNGPAPVQTTTDSQALEVHTPTSVRTVTLFFCFLVGLSLALSPLVFRNLVVSGHVALLPDAGRTNFLIGNSEDSPVVGFSYPTGKPLPLFSIRMLTHLVSKLGVFFWGYEIPQNLNFYLVCDLSLILSLPLAGFSLLVGLSLVVLVIRSRRAEAGPLLGWVLAYALSISLFFVVGRFRLPATVPLCILAASGIEAIVLTLFERPRRGLALVAVALTGWWISGSLPLRTVRFNDYSILLGAAIPHKSPATLLPLADRAVAAYPEAADLKAIHGCILVDLGRPEGGTELELAWRMDPGDERIGRQLLRYYRDVKKDPEKAQIMEARVKELDQGNRSVDRIHGVDLPNAVSRAR